MILIFITFLFLCNRVFSGFLNDCNSINSSLPCLEVKKCNVQTNSITVNLLSNGLGNAQSNSIIDLCYNNSGLTIKNSANIQNYYTDSPYNNCNDAIYNLDVSEFFISPFYLSETAPHCYNEIDINPENVMFESGVYNKNLNHSSVQNFLIDCNKSGISYNVEIKGNSWISTLVIPWDVMNNPSGCPVDSGKALKGIYRANFYRINELKATSKCNSTECEYMAWSPTLSNPPAFHEPTKFGFLIMV